MSGRLSLLRAAKLLLFPVLLLVLVSCAKDTVTAPETTPQEPVISNIWVTASAEEATVTFQTDVTSKAIVEYDIASEEEPDPVNVLLQYTASDTDGYFQSHEVVISGLVPQTDYLFRIRAWSPSETTATSDLHTFSTPDSSVASTSLVISGFTVSDTTDSSAVLYWITNLPADTRLLWGTSEDALNDSITDLSLFTLDHEVLLTGLQQSETYYVRAVSHDVDDRRSESQILSFMTKEAAFLEISGIEVLNVSGSSARIVWTTNRPADSRVFWGIDRQNLNLSAFNEDPVTEHSLFLAELTEETRYYFSVTSTDLEEQTVTSDTLEFTTAPYLVFMGPDTSAALGDTVSYPIVIRYASDLAAAEVVLAYDNTKLWPVDWDEGGQNPVNPGPFVTENDHMFFFPDVDYVNGVITVNITWRIAFDGDIPTGTEADGEGVAAFIRFRTLSTGTTTLDIRESECRAFNVDSQLLGLECDDGSITIQ